MYEYSFINQSAKIVVILYWQMFNGFVVKCVLSDALV